jgi:hypothetical protein
LVSKAVYLDSRLFAAEGHDEPDKTRKALGFKSHAEMLLMNYKRPCSIGETTRRCFGLMPVDTVLHFEGAQDEKLLTMALVFRYGLGWCRR